MTIEAILVLGIMVGTIILFISEKYPLDLVAMIGLGVLLVFGLVTPQEGLAGFSNPATVTVAAMFILSAGLQKTGATAAVGRLMVRFGRNYYTVLVVIMGTVTVMSAFVNNTAAVAVFIPLVTILAARRRISASKLLIPLSYASQFGGVCTLIGTSTNLLVSSISEQAGYGAFSLFEFSRMGLILFGAGVTFFLVFGRWLLPDRQVGEFGALYHLGPLHLRDEGPSQLTISRQIFARRRSWRGTRHHGPGGDAHRRHRVGANGSGCPSQRRAAPARSDSRAHAYPGLHEAGDER